VDDSSAGEDNENNDVILLLFEKTEPVVLKKIKTVTSETQGRPMREDVPTTPPLLRRD